MEKRQWMIFGHPDHKDNKRRKWSSLRSNLFYTRNWGFCLIWIQRIVSFYSEPHLHTYGRCSHSNFRTFLNKALLFFSLKKFRILTILLVQTALLYYFFVLFSWIYSILYGLPAKPVFYQLYWKQRNILHILKYFPFWNKKISLADYMLFYFKAN